MDVDWGGVDDLLTFWLPCTRTFLIGRPIASRFLIAQVKRRAFVDHLVLSDLRQEFLLVNLDTIVAIDLFFHLLPIRVVDVGERICFSKCKLVISAMLFVFLRLMMIVAIL